MNNVKNPFLLYGYVSPVYFCDRESETADIIAALQNGRHVTLMSPRRMGKTGLIHNVFYHIQQQEKAAACFYLDIFSTRSLQDFVAMMGRCIVGKLDTPAQRAGENKLKFRPLLLSCYYGIIVSRGMRCPVRRNKKSGRTETNRCVRNFSLGRSVDLRLELLDHMVVDALRDLVELRGLLARKVARLDELLDLVADRRPAALRIRGLERLHDLRLRLRRREVATARQPPHAEERDGGGDDELHEAARHEFDGFHDLTFLPLLFRGN